MESLGWKARGGPELQLLWSCPWPHRHLSVFWATVSHADSSLSWMASVTAPAVIYPLCPRIPLLSVFFFFFFHAICRVNVNVQLMMAEALLLPTPTVISKADLLGCYGEISMASHGCEHVFHSLHLHFRSIIPQFTSKLKVSPSIIVHQISNYDACGMSVWKMSLNTWVGFMFLLIRVLCYTSCVLLKPALVLCLICSHSGTERNRIQVCSKVHQLHWNKR